MPLWLFLIGVGLCILFIVVLIGDNKLSEYRKADKIRMAKAKKEADKRKNKQLEWPDNIPHI